MPRIPRIHLETTFFHIMTQGINKGFIFDNPTDIKYYINTMFKLAQEHQVRIIAYCIMNNHTHMLLETKDLKELSKYMQRLNMKYGRYYNKKYNRVGYVFRDRYKSEGIYSEKHLNSCIRYIYNNPVEAGICSHAKEYPYSNYKEILDKTVEDYLFMDINENKNETCKKEIKRFMIENDISLHELKEDIKKLRQLIIFLRNYHNISLRKIAEELSINREKVRKIYKNEENVKENRPH